MIDDDWDIIEFAKQLQNLAGGKVQFETIPVLDINGMTDYGESIVKVDPKAVKKYIAGLVGADSEDSEETSEAPTTVNASSITVDVANASDIAGLASGVSEALSASGTSRVRSATTPAPTSPNRRCSQSPRTTTQHSRWPRHSAV